MNPSSSPIATSDLCDAHEGVMPCVLPWRQYGGLRAFHGPAYTLQCYEDIGLMREIVRQPGRGQILVIDGGGSLACALMGDAMGEVARVNGWAGIVVNGAIRDAAVLAGMEIGVAALGTSPRRGALAGKGAQGGVLHFGGVSFEPGCHVAADRDGVVVLPPGLDPQAVMRAGSRG